MKGIVAIIIDNINSEEVKTLADDAAIESRIRMAARIVPLSCNKSREVIVYLSSLLSVLLI